MGSGAPRPRRRHAWTWIQWAASAVLIVLAGLTILDPSLLWTVIGFIGILTLAVGLTELIAPAWFREPRQKYLEVAPTDKQRVGEWFDSALGGPSSRTIRVIGVVITSFGIVLVAVAVVLFAGSG